MHFIDTSQPKRTIYKSYLSINCNDYKMLWKVFTTFICLPDVVSLSYNLHLLPIDVQFLESKRKSSVYTTYFSELDVNALCNRSIIFATIANNYVFSLFFSDDVVVVFQNCKMAYCQNNENLHTRTVSRNKKVNNIKYKAKNGIMLQLMHSLLQIGYHNYSVNRSIGYSL